MNEYQDRIARAQAALLAANSPLLVVSATDQMRYLTGWVENGHERLIALFIPVAGNPFFVVPDMNVSQASTNPAGIKSIHGWSDEDGYMRRLSSLLENLELSDRFPLIFIDDELHAGHLLNLQSLIGNATYRQAAPLLAELRQFKSEHEINSLTLAAGMIDEIFENTIGTLRTGISELEVQDFVLNSCKRSKTTPSFTPLICFGANSAIPHHHTGDTKLKPGDMVIIDIGCTSDFYASDITRTVAFGEPRNSDAARIYDIVSGAHHSARAAIKPGVTAESIDLAARSVISDAGYSLYFIHRTGHGIGLSTHEPPYIVKGNQTVLAPGMCFSVEPGIYLPGRFGVRIENIVSVTEEGSYSLNSEPHKDLRIVPVR